MELNVQTFTQAATEWYEKEKESAGGALPSNTLVLRFARWLDDFKFFDAQMQVLAMTAARDVDRKFINLLIQEVGHDKAKELAEKVRDEHASA